MDNDKEGMIQSTRLQHALPERHAKKPMPVIGADPKLQILQDFPKIVAFFGYPGPYTTADPGGRQPLRPARHVHAGGARQGIDDAIKWGVGEYRRIFAKHKQRMTASSSGGGPDAASARAAAVSVARPDAAPRVVRTRRRRRLGFGYLLLAPAALYVLLLVGAPFLFSLYLALSDANVGDPVASFVGLENFRAAWEMDVFWIALRNSIVFLVVAAILKSILGTTLAFLLLQNFRGKKFVRGLVVIPFTLPIAISVLVLEVDVRLPVQRHQLGPEPDRGSSEPTAPRAGRCGSASRISRSLACIIVNVWRTFPFSAIVLLAGFTSVPTEVLDAARVDGCTFFQRFRHIVVRR